MPIVDEPADVAGLVPFAMIPIWLFDLGPHHVAVYGALASYANNATREGWPSVRSIADRAGVGLTRTREVLASLVEMGAIIITHRTGESGVSKTSVYDIRPAMNDEGRVRHANPRVREAKGEGSPREPELEPGELEKDGSPNRPVDTGLPVLSGEPEVPARARETTEGEMHALNLCLRLADQIEANGCRRPSITKAWEREARLLVDRDGVSPIEVRAAIDWATSHHFWKANILSMPTLRRQFDRLRLQAQAERNGGSRQREKDAAQSSIARLIEEERAKELTA